MTAQSISGMREEIPPPLRGAAASALTRITGQSFPGYYEWATWWFKNRDMLLKKNALER